MTDELFEEWRVYEKLLIHDYMDHRAFFARLQAEIKTRIERPAAILDLGCGDLAPILPILDTLPVSRYVGIDESGEALSRAARRLAQRSLSHQLVRGDLLTALETMEERFDVILASFALHHLPDSASKRGVLEAGCARLERGGLFAVVDVFCREDETREQYLSRWIAHADSRYLALEEEEKEFLFTHVRAHDFPVSLETYRAFGAQAGFSRFAVLLQDEERLNGLVTFSART